MSIEEIVKFIEERKFKAEKGSELLTQKERELYKDGLIFAQGFKDGEIFAYRAILAFISKEEI